MQNVCLALLPAPLLDIISTAVVRLRFRSAVVGIMKTQKATHGFMILENRPREPQGTKLSFQSTAYKRKSPCMDIQFPQQSTNKIFVPYSAQFCAATSCLELWRVSPQTPLHQAKQSEGWPPRKWPQ
mmetsp:Transcript_54380/g.90227  ORF Transcript_54380/g.90227 Transcript_54380/m.90227 type:complete len:127 (-) Transcript_54380:354-734(-)